MAHRYTILIAILMGLCACSTSPDAEYEYLVTQFSRAESVQPTSHDLENSKWTVQIADLVWSNPKNPNVVIRVAGQARHVVTVSYTDEPEPRQVSELIEGSTPVEVRLDHSNLYVYWRDGRSGDHYLLAYDLRDRKVRTKRQVDPSDVTTKNPEHGAR